MEKDTLKLKGQVQITRYKAGTKKILWQSPWMDNQIVANSEHGIYVLLDLLNGDTTHSGEITHGEIGDGNTAPTITDTDLENGLERVALASGSRSGLQNIFRFFFPDGTTADDTYKEFGMFIDGAAGLGTGQLFNRIVLATELVKASGEDYTIACTITGSV